MSKLASAAKYKDKIEKVMSEFKAGKLNSSSGDPVTSRDQAIAIALSEADRAKKETGDNTNGEGHG